MRSVALLLALITSGCALDVGAPLAVVQDGALTARLALPAARDLGDHTLLGAGGERIRVTALAVEVSEVVLSSGGGASSAGGAFDPASPPPGYTLCHSGHCHADDGRLVPYAEIQAEAAGGGGGLAVALAMPVDATADLLAPSALPLTRFEPGRDLGRASIVRGEVAVERLTLRARVEGARTTEVTVDLPLDQRWATTLDLHPAEGPAQVSPRVDVALDGLFLDALASAATTTTTPNLVLDRPDAPGAGELVRALAGTRPVITLADAPSED